ncbi:hypothetical protein ACLOJK_041093 [Asimina triloba]
MDHPDLLIQLRLTEARNGAWRWRALAQPLAVAAAAEIGVKKVCVRWCGRRPDLFFSDDDDDDRNQPTNPPTHPTPTCCSFRTAEVLSSSFARVAAPAYEQLSRSCLAVRSGRPGHALGC